MKTKYVSQSFFCYMAYCLIIASCVPPVIADRNAYTGVTKNSSGEFEKVKTDLTDLLMHTYFYDRKLGISGRPTAASVTNLNIDLSFKKNDLKMDLTKTDKVVITDNHTNGLTNGYYRFSTEINGCTLSWADIKSSQNFADGISFLIRQNEIAKDRDDSAAFEQQIASKYRALKVKPGIKEEQRRFIVQATALTEMKKYNDAIVLYNQAIAAERSTPICYYNQALLYAQVNAHRFAIMQMKKYLALTPDAEDARSARDKIYEWEIFIKQ